MKRIIALASFVILVGSLWADSLVELSRREKARRESLQGKHARVVTNEDLALVRKSLAVISSPEPAFESIGPAATDTPISGELSQRTLKSAPAIRMVPTVTKHGPLLFKNKQGADGQAASDGSLESRLKAAQDLVSLLTTKMNALWQEFYNMSTMTTQDSIQQQIDETYQKLTRAQEEESRLKSELEKSKGIRQDNR